MGVAPNDNQEGAGFSSTLSPTISTEEGIEQSFLLNSEQNLMSNFLVFIF